MPSIHIHLAIAERYVEKHEINNKNELLEGSIAPDFVIPKSISHYSVIRKEKVSVMQELNDSANLRNYLKENEIKSDFDRGYALHILADELFFKEFFTEEYFEKHTEEEFFQNLYKSYDALNLYLIEKYNIEISDDMEQRIDDKIKETIKRKAIDKNQKFENILPVNKVDMFIEKMSDIDIDLYSKNELNKNLSCEGEA